MSKCSALLGRKSKTKLRRTRHAAIILVMYEQSGDEAICKWLGAITKLALQPDSKYWKREWKLDRPMESEGEIRQFYLYMKEAFLSLTKSNLPEGSRLKDMKELATLGQFKYPTKVPVLKRRLTRFGNDVEEILFSSFQKNQKVCVRLKRAFEIFLQAVRDEAFGGK